MRIDVRRFFQYARARYGIMLERKAGATPPWTRDPILLKYRFCNVFREDDKVTKWFKANIRDYVAPNPAWALRAALAFRFVNRIETGEAIKELLINPVAWSLAAFESRLRYRVREGFPILGSAYMIKTPSGMDKPAGLVSILAQFEGHYVDLANAIQIPRSIQNAVQILSSFQFVGGFMAYEVATDLCHTCLLEDAVDTYKWANPGPGAARGIARVAQPCPPPSEMNNVMLTILDFSKFDNNWPQHWPKWTMREVEHTLCEFDKYERARLGTGKPKQLYNGVMGG